MIRFAYTLIIILLAAPLSVAAQNVTVEAYLDSTVVRIGEQLHLLTKVSCPAKTKVMFPEFKSGYVTEGVEVVEAGAIDTVLLNDGKRWELKRDYVLTSFDSAMYSLPPFEIEADGKKFACKKELGLKVNTIDVDMEHPDDLRPLKSPVDGVFVWSSHILLLALAVWGFALIALACVRRLAIAKPVTKRVKITPPTPPQKTALAAIERLKAEDRDGDKQKEYYMALTDVLRNYIVERFGFNAKEMTTMEIVRSLRESGDASALDELQNILDTADLVKFAKYKASLTESDHSLLQAINYVHLTQINDPEAEKAVEKIVVVSDKHQLRYKLALKTVLLFITFAGSATWCYVCYLLWLNFC